MWRLISFLCKMVGATTIIAVLAAALLLWTAGSWLPVQGEPRKADCIVVLAGSASRAMYAADLYNQGLAPRVLVSKPYRDEVQRRLNELDVPWLPDEEVNLHVLLAKGVPREDIGFFGRNNLSTAQEAMELQDRFTGQDASLLVVTSPYHVRRTRRIFGDLLPCCEFHVVGSPYEPFERKWWTEHQSARNLVLETAKFLFYLAGGRFMAPGEPEPSQTPAESS